MGILQVWWHMDGYERERLLRDAGEMLDSVGMDGRLWFPMFKVSAIQSLVFHAFYFHVSVQ